MNHFCHKCGKKLDEAQKYCADCGTAVIIEKFAKNIIAKKTDESWWLRLANVIYILLYILLPFAIFGVWTSNAPYSYYSSYSKEEFHYGSYDEAFWYSLLTLVVWVVVLRLAKIIFLYIALAQKPQWEKEFKKLF